MSRTEMLTGWSKCIVKDGNVCTFEYSPEAARWIDVGRSYSYDANGDPNPWMETTGKCLGKGVSTATFEFPPKGAAYFHVGSVNHYKIRTIDTGEVSGGHSPY